MALTLGKSFDRCYNLRIPFLESFYNIGVYFNKRSSFVLFRIEPEIIGNMIPGAKINMFKNLESSSFCTTFLKLHTYRKSNLDISNQFDAIKDELFFDVHFILNETLTVSKTVSEGNTYFDTLTLYGLTLSHFSDSFFFLIAERQNINSRLNKKIVRTTGLQIATTDSLNQLESIQNEVRLYGPHSLPPEIDKSVETIKFNEVDKAHKRGLSDGKSSKPTRLRHNPSNEETHQRTTEIDTISGTTN